MPKFRSARYPQLQVGSGAERVRFVDGEIEVTEAQAKRLRALPADRGVTEVDPPRPRKPRVEDSED